MTSNSNKARLRIGELAKEFDLNPKTIRYYERISLLPDPHRSPAGYRLYDDIDRERLRFILKAKEVGLALDEIAEILALRDEGLVPCDHMLQLLDEKIALVDQQICALTEFRRELITIREEARETVEMEGRFCRIIEHHQPHRDHAAALSALTLRPSPSEND
ncbi:MAG: heavy metal-responsive transcriptional regulator [Chloroflexota bacterium]|nr:heavy metal-responsive transcriptional regulator [Chloroflexota bacterium]